MRGVATVIVQRARADSPFTFHGDDHEVARRLRTASMKVRPNVTLWASFN